VRLAELAFGLALILAGAAGIAWALMAKTYDDRGDRTMERFLEIGFRYDPIPLRRRDRIGGVIMGLAVVVGGIVFLASQ
jgi:hypothetical protein